jgi:hypothetical protein
VIDLPAMEPCPTGKGARHQLAAILPEDASLDATLFCEICGAIRRFPQYSQS